MTRLLSLLSALAWGGALLQAQGEAVPPVRKAVAVKPRSVVYTVTDPYAVRGFESDPTAERRMVERLVLGLTGQKELRQAWVSLVKPTPTDVVGIKVSSTGGRYFSSHPGVVAAVVSGLELAGIPRSRVVIWDRSSATLREAGFFDRRDGPRVRGIDPPRGFDPQEKITAPTLGRLIWGDLDFRGVESGLRRASLEESQLSSDSHLPRLLTREITKIIVIPTFSDERGCGVAGGLYQATVPNLDNSRRFTQEAGPGSIGDLYTDPRLGGKVILTIIDGLVAQYAGGPDFYPNYAFPYRTLLTSRDPIALDATVLRLLERWRLESNLPSIVKLGSWLEDAGIMGLGTFDEARIAVQAVP